MNAAGKPTIRLLMVCLGNICRSPTAEGVMRELIRNAGLEDTITVDSAGTSDWHIGDAPDPRTIRAAADRGYDLTQQRGRQVASTDFEHFDYILAMDNQNLRDLHKLCPVSLQHKLKLFLSYGNSEYVEVPDPYYSTATGFEQVLNLVEEAAAGLLAQIAAHHQLAQRD